MSLNQTIFNAGRDAAKAGNNIRKINEAVADQLKGLGLTLPLSKEAEDTIEAYRVEYMAGALASIHKAVDKARHLAEGKNAKERDDADKAVLNAATVNWSRIKERAGLKPEAKSRGSKAPTSEAPAPEGFTVGPAADTRAFLAMVTAAYTALAHTANANAKKVFVGEAGSILMGAMTDLNAAIDEATAALINDEMKDVTPKRELLAA